MIKTLRRKFFLTAVLASGLAILVLLGSVNLVKMLDTASNADATLAILTENGGRFPEPIKEPQGPGRGDRFRDDPEARFKARFFVVWLDASGNPTRVDMDHVSSVTQEEAVSFAIRASESGEAGYLKDYRYSIRRSPLGTMAAFLDCTTERSGDRLFAVLSLVFGLAMFGIIVLVTAFVSRRAVAPVREAMEKQRAFISDAGHELKTPLSIISANAEVLELTTGENQWTSGIRRQVSRMDRLLRSMLDLTRLEGDDPQLESEPVDLSLMAAETAEGFMVPAEKLNVSLTMEIVPDISVTGDRKRLEELFSILTDNAVKYAGPGGWVRMELGLRKGRPCLVLENSFSEPLEGDLNRFFDRFYRGDSSRSRETGGYGIGLAMAKSICNAHRAAISVTNEPGKLVRFTVIF